jgi:hypothetical protein
MSPEPLPKADPMAVFQRIWYRLALLFFATWLAVFWFVMGPGNPWYAVAVVWGTCSLEPAIPPAFMQRVPRQWLRVPAGERALHRIAGVEVFGRLLDVSRWNRLIEPMRGFSGKRSGLQSLEQHARFGAIAHGICFAIHVLLAVAALFGKRPWSGAIWMLAPGIIVHLYPVLLQRSMMLRLQPLLNHQR